MTRQKATFELIFAASLWGFGFIAAVWALESVGPFYISAMRMGLAFLVGMPFLSLPSIRKEINLKSVAAMAAPGIALGLSFIFQTWGLMHTSATNSGFITCLYVIIVPLLEVFIFRKKLPTLHLVWTGVALAGMALIVEYRVSDELNFGDLLTLICAVAAAIHIIVIGRVAHRFQSSFAINTIQNFWGGTLCLIIAMMFEPFPSFSISIKSMIGIMFLTFGSTFLAFMLQVRAQKILSPSISSLLFLLESPFAAAFAYLLLNERFTTSRLIGAALIFISAIAATRLHTIKPAEPKAA